MLPSVHSESFSHHALPVCLGRENSNRLVSLWDLMNKFDAFGFGALISLLKSRECQYSPEESKRSGDDPLTQKDRMEFEVLRKKAYELCQKAKFEEVLKRIDMIEQFVNAGSTVSVIRSNLQSLTQELIIGLNGKQFLFIDDDRKKYVDNDALFGEEVREAFPGAETDLIEAGNCLAAECNTASVFHLMRVAEHGLRVLAKRVKPKLMNRKRRCQVEFAEWDKIITGIKNEIETKIAAVRTIPLGARRKEQLRQWSDAADHCVYMRDIFRNDLAHAGKPYERVETALVFERVMGFMMFLSRGLKRNT